MRLQLHQNTNVLPPAQQCCLFADFSRRISLMCCNIAVWTVYGAVCAHMHQSDSPYTAIQSHTQTIQHHTQPIQHHAAPYTAHAAPYTAHTMPYTAHTAPHTVHAAQYTHIQHHTQPIQHHTQTIQCHTETIQRHAQPIHIGFCYGVASYTAHTHRRLFLR